VYHAGCARYSGAYLKVNLGDAAIGVMMALRLKRWCAHKKLVAEYAQAPQIHLQVLAGDTHFHIGYGILPPSRAAMEAECGIHDTTGAS